MSPPANARIAFIDTRMLPGQFNGFLTTGKPGPLLAGDGHRSGHQ
jgi:hypothetical protein